MTGLELGALLKWPALVAGIGIGFFVVMRWLRRDAVRDDRKAVQAEALAKRDEFRKEIDLATEKEMDRARARLREPRK